MVDSDPAPNVPETPRTGAVVMLPLDELWRIHGRVYDLRPFVQHHPGGAAVLESVRGHEDLTAIFESNHAFADRSRVERTMRKFQVGEGAPTDLRFPEGGFYRTVTERVRERVARRPHATAWWCAKAALLTAAWLASFAYAFAGAAAGVPLHARCASALCAGHLFISVGFVVMHDASHSAVSSRPAWNTWLTWLWNACACWDHRLWHKHHVFRHHSFTGDVSRDPDTVHLTPFLKKHASDRKPPMTLARAAPYAATVLFVSVLPGMFVGQAVSYARWWQRGRLWRMEVVRNATTDVAASALRLLLLAVWLRQPLVGAAYVLALNLTYSLCILPDHDTEETRAAAATPSKDWGEEQVRNSANFATRNRLVCALYGGINFQIEHHLFPTLCHVHYADIQPVVRRTCAEFGIPYVDHPTVASAYLSSLRAVAVATSA